MIAADVWMWVVYIFGATLLVSGMLGFYPLYTLFKFSTKKYPRHSPEHKPQRMDEHALRRLKGHFDHLDAMISA